MRRGNYAVALRYFQDALSADPESAAAHAELSLCLSQMNRRFGAMREAELAASLDPELPLVHLAFGYAAIAMGDPRIARASVGRVLAIDPENIDALYLDCWIALVEAEAKALHAASLRLLERAPWRHRAKAMLSRAEAMLGRGKEAEELAREALREDAEDIFAYEALGWAYMAQKKYDLAYNAALRALASAPEDAPAMALLAAAGLRRQRLTGWFFWAAVQIMVSSERTLLTTMLPLAAILMYSVDFLRHLEMSAAISAINTLSWVLVIGLIVSLNLLRNKIDRQVASVRLRSDF